jgi:hypothetical protein
LTMVWYTARKSRAGRRAQGARAQGGIPSSLTSPEHPEESAGEWRQERLAPTSHPPRDPAERDKGFCGKNGIFFQPCSAYLWSNSFCLVCFLGPWRPLFMLREGARWRRENPPAPPFCPSPASPRPFCVGRVCAGGRALMQHFQGSRKKSHEPRFVEIQQVPNKKKRGGKS